MTSWDIVYYNRKNKLFFCAVKLSPKDVANSSKNEKGTSSREWFSKDFQWRCDQIQPRSDWLLPDFDVGLVGRRRRNFRSYRFTGFHFLLHLRLLTLRNAPRLQGGIGDVGSVLLIAIADLNWWFNEPTLYLLTVLDVSIRNGARLLAIVNIFVTNSYTRNKSWLV